MIRPKQWLLAAGVAAAVFTAGCGSSGSSGSPAPVVPTPDDGNPGTNVTVAGPLDALQGPLSQSVLGPLSGVVSGTVLEPVIDSADKIIVQDLLDIVDLLTLGLQDAAATQDPTALSDTAGAVQVQLLQLVNDIDSLLAALAEGTGGDPMASNPLAGTPLEPLGTALSLILDPARNYLKPSSGNQLQLTQLTEVASLLNQQFQSGMVQLPSDAKDAAVIGGVLSSISIGLDELTSVLGAAATLNGAATAAQIESMVGSLLNNVLTEVMPLRLLVEQAGGSGDLADQIAAGSAQVAAVLGDGIGQLLTPVLKQELGNSLALLLTPLEDDVLPTLLSAINDAIDGVFGGGGGGFIGTELGGLIGIVDEVVGSTPVGELLELLPCLFEGTALDFLCPAIPEPPVVPV